MGNDTGHATSNTTTARWDGLFCYQKGQNRLTHATERRLTVSNRAGCPAGYKFPPLLVIKGNTAELSIHASTRYTEASLQLWASGRCRKHPCEKPRPLCASCLLAATSQVLTTVLMQHTSGVSCSLCSIINSATSHVKRQLSAFMSEWLPRSDSVVAHGQRVERKVTEAWPSEDSKLTEHGFLVGL